jgi:hypothetical protein
MELGLGVVHSFVVGLKFVAHQIKTLVLFASLLLD